MVLKKKILKFRQCELFCYYKLELPLPEYALCKCGGKWHSTSGSGEKLRVWKLYDNDDNNDGEISIRKVEFLAKTAKYYSHVNIN